MPKPAKRRTLSHYDGRRARIDAQEQCFCGGEERLAAMRQELEAAVARNAGLALQVERLTAISNVRRQWALSPAAMAEALARLSPCETEVLLLFIERPCDKFIACERGTKLQTVKNQIAVIERKLHVNSREELYALFATATGRPESATMPPVSRTASSRKF